MKQNNLIERWESSVLKLNIDQEIYNTRTPFIQKNIITKVGTGFIIDIEKGHVLTNFKIVDNAISIIGKLSITGDRNINLKLISVCREKDIALCKIDHDDLKYIIRGMNKDQIFSLNMMFTDSMNCKNGEEVISLGYFSSNYNINSTSGIICGFNRNKELELEDVLSRKTYYIEITNRLDYGNIGCPILNSFGKIIGIVSKIGKFCSFVIPSRSILCVYSKLLRSKIVRHPTLALAWNKTNREIMKLKTGSSNTYGIYIRDVFPDSVSDAVETGDIIRRIDFEDPFWCSTENFNIKKCEMGIENQETALISCFLDRFGLTTRVCKLRDPNEVDKPEIEKVYTERKLSLSEIIDIIPIDTKITLDICRNGEWYKLKTKYSFVESDRIKHNYPRLQKIDYEVFAGICCQNLSMNHINEFQNLKYMENYLKNQYNRKVVITNIFSNTNTSKTQVLKPGQLLKSINKQDINCLDDVRHILRTHPKQIEIITEDNSFFMVYTQNVIKEDEEIFENYNIDNHYLLENFKK